MFDSNDINHNMNYRPSSSARAKVGPLFPCPSKEDDTQPNLEVLIFGNARNMSHPWVQHGMFSPTSNKFNRS